MTNWGHPSLTLDRVSRASRYERRRLSARNEGSEEAQRLRALQSYSILDSLPEERFDRITRLAAQVFGVPMAVISFVDEERQWFKSCCGLDAKQTDRSDAFCAHTILRKAVMVVPDATLDPRFRDNRLVTGAPGIRFYAGAPLVTPEGFRLGALCLIDTKPRPALAPEEEAGLQVLADMVVDYLEAIKQGTASAGAAVPLPGPEATGAADVEGQLCRFIENAPVAAAMVDQDMRYLAASRRWIVENRLVDHDLIGRTIDEALVEPGQNRRARDADAADELRWSIQQWRHTDDKPGGLLLFTEIMTENAQTELQLRASEQRFRDLYNKTPVMLHSLDTDGVLVNVSDYWLEALGYERREVLGRRLVEFMTEDSQRRSMNIELPTFFRNGEIRDFEYRFVKKSGEIIDVLLSSRAETNDSNEIVGSQTVLIDVTDRKQAERLSARLGRIIEDSVNEVFVFDAETLNFQMVNRGARENLGYRIAELEGMTPVDIKPAFTKEAFEEKIAGLRSGQERHVTFETVHQRKDGSLYDVTIRLQLMAAETPPVFIAIVEDTTAARAQEEQLRQSQKMEAVGQLTGGMAHDFNNLLAVILGNLQLIERAVKNDERAMRRLRLALEATDRGAELTRRLLAFARQQTLQLGVINANDLINGMHDLLQRTLGEETEFQIETAEGLWPSKVDSAQLEAAVLNLALNARDAMPNGGMLTIETKNVVLDKGYASANVDVQAGDYVLMAVSDTGNGIPAALLDEVVQPFFTTKEVGKGSGLGLSMVYGFVKQSGGHLKIYSEIGHGTTIKIYLPREMTAASKTPRVEATCAELVGGTEKILVVEDDPAVREVAVFLLKDLGYRVLEAEDGATALAILENELDIDLLFSDIIMPGGMKGTELAERALRQRDNIKILHCSGYAEIATRRNGGINHNHELLCKPYRAEDLAQKVRAVLDS